jgi:hypothetical protein
MKIKLLLNNPFAHVYESKDLQPGSILRFYVGYSAHFGYGLSWEEAFDNLKPATEHAILRPWRTQKAAHKCCKCRARRSTLRLRFMTR